VPNAAPRTLKKKAAHEQRLQNIQHNHHPLLKALEETLLERVAKES